MANKKIPKYFLKALRQRTKLAEKLADSCSIVDSWLEKEGFLYENEINDAVITGCLIYVEPKASENSILRFLEENGYEKSVL